MIDSNFLDLFSKYISLDTSKSNGENYSKVIELFTPVLNNIGFNINIYDIPENISGAPNRINLVAKKFISENLPTMLIYNHMDVVPGLYNDAFKFKHEDNKLFGRGACDHKGSTIALLDALASTNFAKANFNIIFWLTCDEETNQIKQLDYMTPILNLPKNTFVYDIDTFTGGVTVAHLHLAQTTITIYGKSAHSAMSSLGINAIEKASDILQYLKTIRLDYEKKISVYKSFPDNLTHITNRCNPTIINSGIASNVIPDECNITIDTRYVPELNLYNSHEEFINKLEKYAFENNIVMKIKNTHLNEGNFCNHILTEKLNNKYMEVTGTGGLFVVSGSTPLAQWTNKNKLPHFGIGVARYDTKMHGDNEFCYEKDYIDLKNTLIKFLTEKL